MQQLDAPKIVQIETCAYCNARCVFCPHSMMKRPMGKMSDELFKKIIDDCKEIKPLRIFPFLNGELFLDEKILDRIKYINDALPNTEVVIYTNGNLLTADKARKLLELSIGGIVFSLNASNEQKYAELMGLDYKKTVANIRRFLEIRKEKGKPTPVCASIIGEGVNSREELRDFKKQWSAEGMDVMAVPFKNWAAKLGEPTNVNTPCFRALEQMTILWDGRVSLCCMDNEGEVILGDTKENTIREIWNGERAKSVRKAHLEGLRQTLPLCNVCTGA